MKITTILLLLTGLAAGFTLLAADPPAAPPPANSSEVTTSTNAAPATSEAAPPAKAGEAPVAAAATAATEAPATNTPPISTVTTPSGFVRLNFRGAPLNLVLDYLSDAAGFIINKEVDVRGSIEVFSKEPVSKDEAVELLNSVLKKNGYAVTRSGRILNIISTETAKTADLEIVQGSDPAAIEPSDEMVTQIIPVRYANASQLMNNLQVLLPTSATLTVNESANSLLLVATKRDIKRMLKIVTALDTSIASVSSIKVFPLKYADAKQLATVVQQLFASQATGQSGMNPRAQLFNMFRGPFGGGGPFGGPGGPGGASGSGGAGGGGSKVTAAADDYSNSLIVSASTEMMSTISDMVQQIDVPTTDITELRVFHLINADPAELADQITQLFPDESRSSTSQNQGFGGGGFRFFGGRFGRSSSSGSSSDRTKKKTQVIAVADPRTSSLLVSAASELMPQLAEMVEQLDANAGKPEVVKVFDLQNADPQDVYQVLQDLFNRNNSMRANNNNSRSLLGTSNPLTQRATQNTTSSRNNNGFSTSGGRGGGF